MVNYWYVSRPNELLIDMDKPERSMNHFLQRLNGAIEHEKLHVNKLEMHHSASGTHLHILITLEGIFLDDIERAVWEIILHSDIYRGCSNIMRCLYDHDAPNLLITPFRFMRPPDATCNCTEKHKAVIMRDCPAAIKLRGELRVHGFFGKPSKSLEMPCYSVTPKSGGSGTS